MLPLVHCLLLKITHRCLQRQILGTIVSIHAPHAWRTMRHSGMLRALDQSSVVDQHVGNVRVQRAKQVMVCALSVPTRVRQGSLLCHTVAILQHQRRGPAATLLTYAVETLGNTLPDANIPHIAMCMRIRM